MRFCTALLLRADAELPDFCFFLCLAVVILIQYNVVDDDAGIGKCTQTQKMQLLKKFECMHILKFF